VAGERYTLEETTVRFGRSKLWLALSIIPSLAMLAIGLRLNVFFFFLFPLPAVIGFLARGARQARVVADHEGVHVDEMLIPRAAFSAALVLHEAMLGVDDSATNRRILSERLAN